MTWSDHCSATHNSFYICEYPRGSVPQHNGIDAQVQVVDSEEDGCGGCSLGGIESWQLPSKMPRRIEFVACSWCFYTVVTAGVGLELW